MSREDARTSPAGIAMVPPNLLILFADQQRADTLGCYGQPLPVTPQLDRLAAEGVRFARAFTCQPVCGPARACLQTGRWATQLGCHTNDLALPREAKTIAHHLGEAGYQTAYVGKWHLSSHGGESWGRRAAAAAGLTGPFFNHRTRPVPADLRGGWRDYWAAADTLECTSHGYGGHVFGTGGQKLAWDEHTYRADAITDLLLGWLEQGRDPSRPFAAMLSWIEPHHQNDHGCYEGPHGSRERFADFIPPGDLAAFPGLGDWQSQYPDYLGCCRSLDDNLGRIRSLLERLGLWDHTVVVYTADHGSHFKTRNAEYKRSCHDACLRIPLIVCGPGWRGGLVRDDLASLIDLPRTLLAAAAVPAPQTMAGRDLASSPEPTAVMAQISESQCGRCLRTRDWTLSVQAVDADGYAPTSPSATWRVEYLYDDRNDPHQISNLAQEPGLETLRHDLCHQLAEAMRTSGEHPAHFQA